jgi:nitroimidazol reductase NimA-like FMN-containing flavoprotein (pyridoxamine 5'-phosphate oxidase superfamily)
MRLVTDEAITETECWEFLESQRLGHVALSIAALPAIVPVDYTVDAAKSVISLYARQATLETALDAKVVAFEVDALDLRTHHGWIVHIVGTARLTAATKVDPDGAVRPVVELTPAVITGRRVPAARPP